MRLFATFLFASLAASASALPRMKVADILAKDADEISACGKCELEVDGVVVPIFNPRHEFFGAEVEALGAKSNLGAINGVISVSAGDDLGALAPKAASGITYSEGEATIFVTASAGRFVKAVIGQAAPEDEE